MARVSESNQLLSVGIIAVRAFWMFLMADQLSIEHFSFSLLFVVQIGLLNILVILNLGLEF